MKPVLIVLAVVFGLFAQASENYNGWGDTSRIAEFRADSLKYSKVFQLSKYENLRIDMMIADTAAATFAADSIKTQWGVVFGHPVLSITGVRDTVWSNEWLVIDTLNALTTTNAAIKYNVYGTDGTYNTILGAHDTLSVSGFIVQSRAITPAWDVFFKVWVKGLTGNNVSGFLNTRVNVVRRLGVVTK